MAHVLTTCTFCGVGCGIYLETDGNRVTGAYPSLSHPTNAGRICVRGWHVHEVASSPDRLRTPLLRRHDQLVEVSWEDALDFLTRRMREILNRFGPNAFAFYNTPRCSNEESYLLQKLARAVIGTNNVDHGTGVYSNNSIQVLLDALGVPAATNAVADLAHSDVILVDSVDLGSQLPTIAGWVIRARLKGAKLIVIDARRHRVAENADCFLQLRPGTDVLLYGAMAKVIVDRGLMNQAFISRHCRDYEPWLARIQEFDLLEAASLCGVEPALIEQAAVAYAGARAASLLYSTGAESRSKDSLRSLVNLALLTGQLGRCGAGVFALTEQNNLQGACDMGMLPDRLPGYEPVGNAAFRGELGARWHCTIPAAPGLGVRALLERGGADPVRALWLCRYDPTTTATFCDASAVLGEFDLVVVQHLFKVAATASAHVVLPLVAFGEEEVTFTSTDRRIQLARKVLEPPPGPMPCWQQLTRVARGLGADWHYNTAAEVMDEIAQVVPFYSGASHQNLGRDYGRQWPCTLDQPLGTTRLFEGAQPHHGFRFAPVRKPATSPLPTEGYPVAMVFGQSLYYWHQSVLIQNSETLRRELRVLLLDYPEGFVEMNEADAKSLGVRDGFRIRLVAPGGTATTTARVTGEIRAGTLFVPFFVRQVVKQILGPGATTLGNMSRPVFVRVEKA